MARPVPLVGDTEWAAIDAGDHGRSVHQPLGARNLGDHACIDVHLDVTVLVDNLAFPHVRAGPGGIPSRDETAARHALIRHEYGSFRKQVLLD